MRHQKHGRKFGRKTGPRHALYTSLVTALLEHERIETTDAKAKEIRRIAEKAITWAASVGKIVESDKSDAEDKARVVHAMRMAGRVVHHKPTLHRLFQEIGPRFVGRPGGYTRILKVRTRVGDAAPMSIIELVDRVEKVDAKAPEPTTDAPKGKSKAPKAEAAPKKAKAEKSDAGEKAKPAKKAKKSEA